MKGCYIIVLVVERNENKTQGYALLAQLVEQRTLNPSVQGSTPCAPTNSEGQNVTVLPFFLSRRTVFRFFSPALVIRHKITH